MQKTYGFPEKLFFKIWWFFEKTFLCFRISTGTWTELFLNKLRKALGYSKTTLWEISFENIWNNSETVLQIVPSKPLLRVVWVALSKIFKKKKQEKISKEVQEHCFDNLKIVSWSFHEFLWKLCIKLYSVIWSIDPNNSSLTASPKLWRGF